MLLSLAIVVDSNKKQTVGIVLHFGWILFSLNLINSRVSTLVYL